MMDTGRLTLAEADHAIAAAAEGYAFPTDCDPPVGGLARKSQALRAGTRPEGFAAQLAAAEAKRRP